VQGSLVRLLDAGLSQDVDCRQMLGIREEGDFAAVSKLTWLGTDGEGCGTFLMTMKKRHLCLGALPHEQEQALLRVSRSAMVLKKSVKQRLKQMLNSQTWHAYVTKAETYQRLEGGGNAAVANEIVEASKAAHAAGSMATLALEVASKAKAGHEGLEKTVSNLQVEVSRMRRDQHEHEVKLPVAVAAAAAEQQERFGETFDNGQLKCNLCQRRYATHVVCSECEYIMCRSCITSLKGATTHPRCPSCRGCFHEQSLDMVAAVRLGEVANGRVLDSTESIFRQRMADPDLASPEPKRTKTADRPPSPIYSEEAEEAVQRQDVANAVSYATEAALLASYATEAASLANAANAAKAAAAADEAKARSPGPVTRYSEEQEEEEVEEEEEEEAQRTEKPEVEEEQAEEPVPFAFPSSSTDAAQFSAGICEQEVEQLAEILTITPTAARKKLQCLDVHSHHEFKGQLLNLAISQHYSGIAAKKR
jgi:hypothetical protein